MTKDPVTSRVSNDDVVSATLEQLIARLERELEVMTASLTEAKRLREAVGNWPATPPKDDQRTAMIVRITELVESSRQRQ